MTDGRRLRDIIDPLSIMAAEALDDPYGRGRDWSRAVARGNVAVLKPGARVSKKKYQILVGDRLHGTANHSFVLSDGAMLRTSNAVVVGNNTCVVDKKGSAVIGQNVRVRKARGRVTVSTKVVQRDVYKKNVYSTGETQRRQRRQRPRHQALDAGRSGRTTPREREA